MSKRFLSMLLVLCMLVGLFPVSVSAAEANVPFTVSVNGEQIKLYDGGEGKTIAKVPAGTTSANIVHPTATMMLLDITGSEILNTGSKDITVEIAPEGSAYCVLVGSYYYLYFEVEAAEEPEQPEELPEANVPFTVSVNGEQIKLYDGGEGKTIAKVPAGTTSANIVHPNATMMLLDITGSDILNTGSKDITVEIAPEGSAYCVLVGSYYYLYFEVEAAEEPEQPEEPAEANVPFTVSVNGEQIKLYDGGEGKTIAKVPSGTTSANIVHPTAEMMLLDITGSEILNTGSKDITVEIAPEGSAYCVLVGSYYYLYFEVEAAEEPEQPEELPEANVPFTVSVNGEQIKLYDGGEGKTIAKVPAGTTSANIVHPNATMMLLDITGSDILNTGSKDITVEIAPEGSAYCVLVGSYYYLYFEVEAAEEPEQPEELPEANVPFTVSVNGVQIKLYDGGEGKTIAKVPAGTTSANIVHPNATMMLLNITGSEILNTGSKDITVEIAPEGSAYCVLVGSYYYLYFEVEAAEEPEQPENPEPVTANFTVSVDGVEMDLYDGGMEGEVPVYKTTVPAGTTSVSINAETIQSLPNHDFLKSKGPGSKPPFTMDVPAEGIGYCLLAGGKEHHLYITVAEESGSEQPESPVTHPFGFAASVDGEDVELYEDGTADNMFGVLTVVTAEVPAGTSKLMLTSDGTKVNVYTLMGGQISANTRTVQVDVSESGSQYLITVDDSTFLILNIVVKEGEQPEGPAPISAEFTVSLNGNELDLFDGGKTGSLVGEIPVVSVTVPAGTAEVVLTSKGSSLTVYTPEGGAVSTYNPTTVSVGENGAAYLVSVSSWVYLNILVEAGENAEKFTITTPETNHGQIEVDPTEAAAGETVQLCLAAEEGYELDKILFTKTADNSLVDVKLSEIEDGVYSFTMPAFAITISAVFAEIKPADIVLSVGDVEVRPGQVVYVPVALETILENKTWDITVDFTASEGLSVGMPETGESFDDGAFFVNGTGKGHIYFQTYDYTGGSKLNTCVGEKFVLVPVQAPIDAAEGTTYELNGTMSFSWMVNDTPSSPKVQYNAGTITVKGEPVEQVEAMFPTIVLGNAEAHPGDLVEITMTFLKPESASGVMFFPYYELPEGWEIVETVDLIPGDVITVVDNHLWNKDGGHYGSPYPAGTLVKLMVQVPADAEVGEYVIDMTRATLGKNEWEYSFDQYEIVDGIVKVTVPDSKTKLTAPVLREENVDVVTEVYIQMALDGSEQEAAAVTEFAYRAKGTEDWSEWTSDSVLGVIGEDTTKWLQDGTVYEIKARYNAHNDTWYTDSDESNVIEVETIAFVEEPAVFTIGNASGGHGDIIEVPLYLDHSFGNLEFNAIYIAFESNENIIFKGIRKGADAEGITIDDYGTIFINSNSGDGFVIPKGEIAVLTLQIGENTQPGEYQLGTNEGYCPTTFRYSLGQSYIRGSYINYPANIEVVKGTITVKAPMEAPVLTDATVTENAITITAPATEGNVRVEYAISENGVEWGEWQAGNCFTGLKAETKYYFRARFVAGADSEYGNSYESNVITATTSYDDVAFAVKSTAGMPGDTVEVSIELAHSLNNKATSISLTPVFDEKKVSVDDVVLGDAMTGWKLVNVDGVIEVYTTEAAEVPQGELVVLSVKLLSAGDSEIDLSDVAIYAGEAEMKLDYTVKQGTVHAHEATDIPAVTATCYADGLTAGQMCAECEEILLAQEVVKSQGHKMVNTVNDPTHEKMGYTLYECENCDYSFVSDWTDAIGHKYEKTISKAATCTEDGEWTFKCECGKTYTEVMPKTGHSCEATLTAPTCEDMGYTTYECKNCDFSYINDLKDALGHKETVVGKKEATVEAEGYTGDTVCSVCQTVLVKGEVIAKLEPTECICAPFTDVDTSKWYHEAVDFVLEAKLMNGTSDTTFAPMDNTNRAMLATLLYRLAGEPSVAGMANPFTDVPAGKWYTNAVIWAANEGIVTGTTATTFAPMKDITREQMVAMLWRYAGEPEADEAAMKNFTDAATVSNYAKEAMAWAIETGLVSGVSKTTIAPKGTANRAQIATILMRYIEK